MRKTIKITIILISVIILFGGPLVSQAGGVKLQVPIDEGTKEIQTGNSTAGIGKYIASIYKYAVGAVGILATVVMMIGGVVWITAGGNASRISEAKAWIGAALSGLVLVLTSYMILNTLNPDLVRLRPTGIKTPDAGSSADTTGSNNNEDNDGPGCCIYFFSDQTVCDYMDRISQCAGSGDTGAQPHPGQPCEDFSICGINTPL